MFLKTAETIPFLKYSPKNNPTAKEKGVAIINASNEVSKDHIRKGNAQYLSETGSHDFP